MASQGTPDPDWIREALRQTWHELALYGRTLRAVSLSPRTFAARWGSGLAADPGPDAGRPMAPLAFFATSLALHLSVRQLSMAWVDAPGAAGFWAGLADSALPYLEYVAIALCVHPLMRWLGSQRRLRSTVGVALYAGGGPAALVKLVFIPLFAVAARLYRFRPLGHGTFEVPEDARRAAFWLGLSVSLAFLAYLVCFTLALAGLHQVRARKTGPALLLAFVVALALLVPIRLQVTRTFGKGTKDVIIGIGQAEHDHRMLIGIGD